MQWVNEAYFGRLFVQEVGLDTLHISDTLLNEVITVELADDPHGIEMRIGECTLTTYNSQRFLKGQGAAQRDVWHFVTRDHATALRAGLTVHRNAFSSTPHAFELETEPGFEEVFYFMFKDGGKGLLEGEGLWPDGTRVNAAWPIAEGDAAQVPMGWHRVVALPDADGVAPKLAYIWAYLCTKPEWEKD